jgi:predicted nicotinamide N-methyase
VAVSGREPLPELLDLAVERIPLGDRPVTVARPADWQVLRETEAAHGRDAPYWAIQWPSGEALAQAVADEPPPPGARVLELGCGLALPSVAAARAGATVLATDASPDAIAFAAHTLALDGQVGDVAAIDWREPRWLLEQGPWDLVLAADVLYLQANVRMLLDLLPKLVAPGGQVWIADPGRTGAGELLGHAGERWTVVSTPSARHEAVAIHRLTLKGP